MIHETKLFSGGLICGLSSHFVYACYILIVSVDYEQIVQHRVSMNCFPNTRVMMWSAQCQRECRKV